jgi:uncharacterized damage-inducible protein DinB
MNYHKQFQFNEEVTGRFIDVLIAHPDSPEEVKKWLSHSLNALHIWLCRIANRSYAYEVWQIHPSDKLHEINSALHSEIFELLESGNLHSRHVYRNTEGNAYSNTLDEILMHLIIHSAHHRAQMSSSWRQVDIDPPVSDFIFWARSSV